MLNRDSILAAKTLPMEKLDVPEWGGSVWVRTLSGLERDRWEAGLVKGKGKGRAPDLVNVRAKLAVLCVADENGNRILADSDADELGKGSAKVLARIYDVAARLNGLTEEDVEELAGN